MDATTGTAVAATKYGPPVVVAGASFVDAFNAIPISSILQWASLVWLLVQAGFYLYDRFKKKDKT